MRRAGRSARYDGGLVAERGGGGKARVMMMCRWGIRCGIAFGDLQPGKVAAGFPHFGNGAGEVGAHGGGEGRAYVLARATEEAEERVGRSGGAVCAGFIGERVGVADEGVRAGVGGRGLLVVGVIVRGVLELRRGVASISGLRPR